MRLWLRRVCVCLNDGRAEPIANQLFFAQQKPPKKNLNLTCRIMISVGKKEERRERGRDVRNGKTKEVEEGKRKDKGRATWGEKGGGRKLNVGRALNLSLITCGLLNQQSP